MRNHDGHHHSSLHNIVQSVNQEDAHAQGYPEISDMRSQDECHDMDINVVERTTRDDAASQVDNMNA